MPQGAGNLSKLSPGDLRRLMTVARRGRQPERDRVMVLLDMRAGLRAFEIAGLTWAMVLDANGPSPR